MSHYFLTLLLRKMIDSLNDNFPGQVGILMFTMKLLFRQNIYTVVASICLYLSSKYTAT